ncbi:hypothetical protein PRIPAC_80719 [Pristionchus pacificus]|uniref:Uncharacterized protein n=1 Tax=Pristionchus pacificus TaxID=54126 RepID=A0A2A6C2M9_PRIPA|nr:hypothetical protein PRIPAC_80719 [Pristionchus pacificus]|eukprot:PDM72396.1 hypothetical protein PRIPAC_38830 [Pristionchus pacificus]
MSQFESSYKKLLSSISSLSPLVTSIENDISQIFEISSSDEIEKISARVARILVDAQIIRDDYSDRFSSLTQAINSMDDTDSSKDVEQRKLQEFKSSSEAATSMEVDPVSVANVVSKLENKFRRSLETATVRASALSRLTPPISILSQSIPLPSTPVDGDSTSTSTAHIEYQTLAAKIVDLEARLSNSNAQSSPHSNIVLPPITLQTFDGVDITKWPAYKYQLDMLILNQPQYNEVEKICYVRSTLRGTALSLISTIPTNKDFLAKIIARLETEYSRPNLTQATLLQSLLKVQSKSNKLEDQLDTVRIMINLVHSISDDCGLDGLVMQQQIADRIHPRFIPVIWRRRSTTLLESLELIEETLRTELEDVTMINAISDRNHHQKSVVVNNYSGGLSMPRSSVTNSSPPSHKAPRATVANPVSNTFATAHVLLDHGAQATLISRDLVNRLALIPFETREMAISGINGDPSKVSPHDIVNVDIVTDRGKVHIEAIVREGASVNTIYTDPLPRDDLEVIQATIGSVPSHFSESSTVHSDLLLSIGDTLELLESATETKLPCGYRLVQSSIGPLVVGSNRPRTRTFDPIVSALTIHKDETLDEKIERLFAVDPIARVYETTEKEARKVANALVNQHFDDTVEKQGDEYIVQYSVKPEAKIDLPSNFDLAVSRLSSTLRTLSKQRSNLEFCVTPFGINASPSILNKVIHHHVRLNGTNCDPTLIHQLVSNLYVDNVIINVDLPTSLMYTESKSLFETMSMNLRDYASNDPSFLSIVPESDRAKDETQKILGLLWNTTTDRLSINIPISNKSGKVSKRSMLSTVCSPYDPLGLLNPLILPPRLTTQNLWNTSLKWDDPVDETIRSTFHEQMSELENFNLSIDRYAHLSDSDEITLVAFSDASKQAKAACIYSWSSNAQPTLLISKTRLAPIKCTSTIPKMELDSLVMAHTLVRFTVEALRKEFPEKPIHAYFYSDSAVVLHWCKPEFRKQPGVFVVNRIKKIHDTRDELASFNPVIYHHPRHVRSESNPADHATRGLSAKDMNDPKHAWWSGPEWLKYDPDSWPNDDLSSLQCPSIDSFPMAISAVAVVPPIETVIKLERFSSLRKAIAVTSRVYRFLSICASRVQNTSIHEKLKHLPTITSPVPSAVERRFALNSLIKLHQTKCIPSSDPLVRKGEIVEDPRTRVWKANTRLANASLISETKSPVFIPTSTDSILAKLIISDIHHSSSHASVDVILNQVKRKYWIPRCRQIAKSVLKQCVPCRKTNNLPFRYPQSPALPVDRVRKSRPFEHSGVDYAGPFHSNTDEKMYVLVFTCFSTRLSHLEVVNSLLPSSFTFAFRRPPEEENSSREAAIQQLKRSITIVDAFWNRWHSEYLTTLRDCSKKSDPLHSVKSTTHPPIRGSLVLVVDESGNTPRSSWKMAKILSLTNTSATLKSHAGRVIERPLNLLIPLEIHSNENTTQLPVPVDEPEPINTHPMTTRSKKTPEERDPNRSLAPEPIDIPSNVKNKMPIPTTVVAKPKKPKILFDHDRVVKDITNSVEKKMKKIVLNVVTEGVGLLKEHFDSLVSQLSMSVDSLSDVVSTNLVDPTPIVVHATDVTPSTTRPPHVTPPLEGVI